MKICITGGAGYIGSVMTEMMVNKGWDITVIDNLEYGQANPLFNLFHTGKVHFVYGDVTNQNFMRTFFKGNKFDYIIPLAAVVGFPISEQKPEYTRMVNINQILYILSYKNKGAKLIYPNTNSGYGMTEGNIECTEKQELRPTSTYGITKCEAEDYIRKREIGNKKSEYVIFRLATVFGMSQRMRTDLMVNNFVHKAYTDKFLILFERKFVRNFVHIRDVSRAFIFAIEHWNKVRNNVYNLGHPQFNINKLQLAEIIKKELPTTEIIFKEGRTDPDKRNYIVSNKKILATGFKFQYPLDKGIKELIEGYKAMKDHRFKNCEDSG